MSLAHKEHRSHCHGAVYLSQKANVLVSKTVRVQFFGFVVLCVRACVSQVGFAVYVFCASSSPAVDVRYQQGLGPLGVSSLSFVSYSFIAPAAAFVFNLDGRRHRCLVRFFIFVLM